MNSLTRVFAEFFQRPSAAAEDALDHEIFTGLPRESEEKKARREALQEEHDAIDEARQRASLDESRVRWAREYPTFGAHLEEARQRRGLA